MRDTATGWTKDAPAAETAPAGHIDIVSDAICPWCWIGRRHLEGALRILGEEGMHFTIAWRPYELNPDMPAAGVARDAYRARKFGNAERARELDAQVADVGRAAGLEFRFDRMTRTPNTIEAHRLLRLAEPSGLQDALAEALFRAYFGDGQDIGERAVLASIGRAVGLDDAVIAEFEAGEAARREVMAEATAMRQAGLNGVPSFVLDRHLLFSGALPPEQMAASIARAVRILRERAAA